MTETRLGEKVFRYDQEATLAAYQRVSEGDADRCKCSSCANFAVQRTTVYPLSFREFLLELGIDPAKEREVFSYEPLDRPPVLYGGWFCFIGEMIDEGQGEPNSHSREEFQFWVTSSFPAAPLFGPGPVLAVEFLALLAWVLPPEPMLPGTTASKAMKMREWIRKKMKGG